jgi:hypothetical protein
MMDGNCAPAILSLNIKRPTFITSQPAETKAGGQATIDISSIQLVRQRLWMVSLSFVFFEVAGPR